MRYSDFQGHFAWENIEVADSFRRCVEGILLNCMLVLAGLGFAMIAAEIALRVWEQLYRTDIASDRPGYYYMPARSSSMRDYDPLVPKPDHTFRIAVIGDSFTFAPEMQFDDTFPKRLERILNTLQLDPDSAVEVVNYGVPGYSTNHEVEMIWRAIKQGADLLILQITLNDAQLKPYRPTGLKVKNPYVDRKQNRLDFWSSRLVSFVKLRLSNSISHEHYKNYYLKMFDGKQRWKTFSASMKEIKSYSQKNQVPLKAVVFPLFGMPIDQNYPFDPVHEKIENLLKELQIDFLDLKNAFQGIPLERIQLVPNYDFHPNELGHRIAAEHLALWLAEMNRTDKWLNLAPVYRYRKDVRKEVSGAVQLSELAQAVEGTLYY